MRSVAPPATVPECIGVASYSTRLNSYEGDMTPGSFDLSYFSGRGPRIDEVPLIDIAAPGNSDIISTASSQAGFQFGSYDIFGGTSAAGPHVAAAAALILQDDPSRSPEQVSQAITDGATTDGYMGTLPDEEWGYGKMDIYNSLISADETPPSAETMTLKNPLLPNTNMILVSPSETLSVAPTIVVELTDGAELEPSLWEVGYSWWITFLHDEPLDINTTSIVDLAGNESQ